MGWRGLATREWGTLGEVGRKAPHLLLQRSDLVLLLLLRGRLLRGLRVLRVDQALLLLPLLQLQRILRLASRVLALRLLAFRCLLRQLSVERDGELLVLGGRQPLEKSVHQFLVLDARPLQHFVDELDELRLGLLLLERSSLSCLCGGDLPCLELCVQLLRLLQLLLLLGGRGVRPLCLLETGLLLHRLQVRQHGLLLLLLLVLVVLLKLLLRLVLLRRRRRRRRLLLRLHRAGMSERRIVGEQRARERG